MDGFRPFPIAQGLLAASFLSLIACAPSEQPGPPQVRTIQLDSAPGAEARVYPPPEAGPTTPGLVLYAASEAGAAAFEFLAEAAQLEGYGVVLLDAAHRFERPRQEGGDLARAAAGDLAQACDALVEAGASRAHIAVVGEARTTPLVLEFAAGHAEIAAAVLLSPLLETRGVQAQPALERFGRRPVLIMAGRDDSLTVGALETLKPMAKGMCEVRVYGAAARGADLLNLSARVHEQILLWLRPILGAALQNPYTP